jgi:hypothetical protein
MRYTALLRSMATKNVTSATSPELTAWLQAAPTVKVVEHDTISLSRIRGLVSTIQTDGLAHEWTTGCVQS